MSLRKIHIDVWLGILFIALSVYFYVLTDEFFDMEAAKWPRGVLIVIGTLSTLLFIHGIIETKNNLDSGIPSLGTFAPPIIATIIIAAYAVAMEYTDYFISTAIFVPLGMFLQGQRSWKVIIFVTAGLEIFVYLLFVLGLNLRMP